MSKVSLQFQFSEDMEMSLLQPLEASLQSTTSTYCGRASHLFTKKLKQSILSAQRDAAQRWRAENPGDDDSAQVTRELSSSAHEGGTCGAGEALGYFFFLFKSLSDLDGKCTETTLAPQRFWSPGLPQTQFLMVQTIRMSDVLQSSCSHFIHFFTGKKKDNYITKLVLFRVFY